MGTYDVALEKDKTVVENEVEVYLQDAKESTQRRDHIVVWEKYVKAVDCLRVRLSQKPHCRHTRDQLGEVLLSLSTFYPKSSWFTLPTVDPCYDQIFSKRFLSYLTTSVSDLVLGTPWKRQYDGKYGGPKPNGVSWRDYYLYCENSIDDLTSLSDRVLWAVTHGHALLFSHLIRNQALSFLNHPFGDEQCYLIEIAISNADVTMVSLLLDAGVSVHKRVLKSWYPLHLAAYKGNVEIVKLLLDHGAKRNVKDAQKFVPLHMACLKGHYDVVACLVENGAKTNLSEPVYGFLPIHLAMAGKYFRICDFLLAHTNLKRRDFLGRTFLHWAVGLRNPDVVHLVLDKVGLLDVQDQLGRTVTHWAAQLGDQDMMSLLLQKRPNVMAVDQFGETPMVIAAFLGHTRIVSDLFEFGGC